MKILIFFVFLFLVSCSGNFPYKEKYFEQNLDHFNFQSFGNATYKQRYFISNVFFRKPENPIFFYTGNEGDIESFIKASGFVGYLAAYMNALIVFAEHRYYGKSLPFGEDSFKPGKIGLLTIEQALADYANLMVHLKAEYGTPDSPIVTFGGSYGGQLAAYMRIKYPNLVTGALSASAPLYWITNHGNSHGFWESVTKTFSSFKGCRNVVEGGFSRIKRLAEQGSYDVITDTFKTCEQIDENNLPHLLEWIRNAFTDLAMMNYPYPTDFLAPLPGNPVKAACEQAVKASSDLQGLSIITSLYYKGDTSSTKCSKIFEEYVKCSDPTGCGLGNDAIAWDYQGCTEIILPGGTNSSLDMFPTIPFTPQMRSDYCRKKFGVEPRVNWIATEFWTERLKLASNIIFSNGDLDPWADGGVKKDLSPSLPAIKVIGGAHHLDLRTPNDADPSTVEDARYKECDYILKWIKNATSNF